MATVRNDLVQCFYDLIVDACGTLPSGTRLLMCRPGIPVVAADFADPWSPINPTGSLAAGERFYRLTDPLPADGGTFVPSGYSLDAVYEEITNASVVPTYAGGSYYDFLNEPLWNSETIVDALGNATVVYASSSRFKEYSRAEAACAVSEFATRLSSLLVDHATDVGNAGQIASTKLQLTEFATLLQSAEQAQGSAEAGGFGAAMSRYRNGSHSNVAQFFTNARRKWELSKRPSVLDTTPGLFWHLCTTVPTLWYEDKNFAAVAFNENELRLTGSSGESEDLIWAAWRWIAGLGWVVETTVFGDSTGLSVKFRMARVVVERSWMDYGIVSLGGWSAAGRSPGQFSGGTTPIFPLFPTSFIVVRDVELSGVWDPSDLNFIRAMSGDTSGPFGIGRGCSCGPFTFASVDEGGTPRYSAFDGTTMRFEDPQIVAWICSEVPYSPPL